MLNLANIQVSVLIKQEAATNAATLTSDTLDTQGCDFVKFLLHATTSNNATNKPSVLKVQEADSDSATNYADVAALVGGGASGFTIPSSPTATTTKPFAILNVDTRARKRYLRVLVSPVTTQTFSLIAIKGRQEQSPVGATAENAAVVANG